MRTAQSTERGRAAEMNFLLCDYFSQALGALFEWRDRKLSGDVETTQLLDDLLAQICAKVLHLDLHVWICVL